jgi:predicted ABC-type sugar transport system permease subunit
MAVRQWSRFYAWVAAIGGAAAVGGIAWLVLGGPGIAGGVAVAGVWMALVGSLMWRQLEQARRRKLRG